ncbi:hypothetical protein K450DRAFT_258229 [Umbelopsis ramanniana AG]|uniref:CID domain-containing protein n=1 Tax=Umbelopsis ramanniana AG TaxID=1314678 RepID=A0AAD5E465_UMBRA|nr:uncharacterized protein K450DRAFT_258229 [Umbelopsis ramanniana AG]KAI8576146.1 hypothetical protein K450DRAFT_258229 [Umbelopsis ramanniana AG]
MDFFFLLQNASNQKLPVIYLVDSICKNVGEPYIQLFARNIASLFLESYTRAEVSTRRSFERLLQTWKNGMPDGRPVFSRSVLEPIERSVRYLQQQSPQQQHQPPSQQGPNIMRDPRQRYAASPSQSQYPSSGISPSQQQTLPTAPQPDVMSTLQSILSPANGNSGGDPTTQILVQLQSLLPTLPPAQAAPIQQYLAQILPPGTPPPASVSSSVSNMNALDLMKNLTSLGLLGGVSSGQPASEQKKDFASGNMTVAMFGPFRLESKDIQTVRKGAVEFLYSALPLKCKQCGYRYPDTEEGKKKMDAHLDFHFRQNRRSKERAKRGLSRSWFVTESEWVNGVDIESTSQHPPIFADEQSHNGTGGGSGQQKNKKVEELDADSHMVVVPADSQGRPCPICGEQFITIWNDGEEEWMYKNAVNINGTIYHATCHADASHNMEVEELEADQIEKKRKAVDDLAQDSKILKTE